MRQVLFALVLIWSVAASALAQDGRTGELVVNIVDQTGQSLSTAAVIAAQGTAEPVSGKPTTNPGEFRFTGLPPGKYTLTVMSEGFVPVIRSADAVAGRPTRVRVQLNVRLTEKVQVSGLKIGTPNSLTGFTLSGRDLDALPSNELELLYRLRELAGSRGRPGDFAIYVDGFRDFRRLPPKSAIDVIQINAEPYSAQFGEPGTRRIEIITKPGADGTFGEVKSDISDGRFNAQEPLATSKPTLRKRSLTAYFSAPIIKQKWGFYVYAGQWDQDENAVIRATTLDDQLDVASFQQTQLAPQRLTNMTANTGFALGQSTRIKLEYSRDGIDAKNQALTGGLDLPERGIAVNNTIDTGRFSVLSVWGPSAVFEMRVQTKNEYARTRAASSDTAIMVLDAFNAGGNQSALYRDDTTKTIQFDSKLTKVIGSHNLKVGVQTDFINFSQLDYNNFGGTFLFGADVERRINGTPIFNDSGVTIPISPLETYRRTLLGLTGYGPALFTITLGDPTANIKQYQGGAYVQDDWIASKSFTLSAGLRYEAQTNLTNAQEFAPRVGFAWSLKERGGIIRSGAGVFYKRVDPSLTLNTIRFDGRRQRQYVVLDPTFNPPPVLDEVTDKTVIMTKADDLRAGRMFISNIGYERAIFGPLFGSATYTWEQGDRLPRLHDINTPLAPGGARPMPLAGQVLQYESVGGSRRHELQIGIRAAFNAGSRILVNYTLASAKANTDDAQTQPADSRDLANEWGRSAGDERHRIYLSGTVMLPHYYVIIPSFTYATPRPFNITTGLDNNLDGHVTDRPSFATAHDAGAVMTPFGRLNPFPKAGETIIPRNSGQGRPALRADLSFAKVFILGDPKQGARVFSTSLNFQNLLNTTNLRDFNGVLLSPLFDKANTAEPARRMTLGFAVNF